MCSVQLCEGGKKGTLLCSEGVPSRKTNLWLWKVLTVFTKDCRTSCYSVLFIHQYLREFVLPKYMERCPINADTVVI